MFPATQRDLARHGLKSGLVKSGPAAALLPARVLPARAGLAVRAGRALLALCAGATVLIGCPLYSDDCNGRNDCASGFYCDQFSQRCQPFLDETGCSRPSQCESGETCTPDFVCRPGSCDYYGCVTGYRCGIADSAHACVPVAVDSGPTDAGATNSGPVGTGRIDASLPSLTPADAGDAGTGPSDAGLDSSVGN